MFSLRSLILVAMTALLSRQAFAQDTFELHVQEPGAPTVGAVYVGGGPRADVALLAVEPFEAARPVLDRPYTAEAVTEITQTLADGNRIAHQTKATIARDSRGRIRREHDAMFLGPLVAERNAPLVTITDPSRGTHVTLDNERRVAFRAKRGALAAPPDRQLVKAGRPAPGSGAIAPVPTDVRTEQLGEKEIEGVRAEGTRTVMTIPAGAIGNELPIEVVSERWYSPDLQVVVMSRRFDPRFGETIYRLTNIVRVEPPADLFEVPEGFRTDEGPGLVFRRKP